jgi:hypothetical protein
MAAISLDDCTVTHLLGTPKIIKIVTPATADDGDTIDVSSEFKNGCFNIHSGATDGGTLDTTVYGTTITLQGSTDDEARTIIAIGE